MIAVVLFCKTSTLYFLNRYVLRGAVLLDSSGVRYNKFLSIPLARCTTCKTTCRVLPLEILPYKTHGIAIIELSLRYYGFHISDTLRFTTTTIKHHFGYAPDYSTLWRWSAGLGEKIVGREPQVQRTYSPPCSSILAQTTRRQSDFDVADLFLNLVSDAQLYIAQFKYHSERRFDQLLAVVRLLILARQIFGKTTPSTLLLWNQLLLRDFFVPVWSFPSQIRVTTLQQLHPP